MNVGDKVYHDFEEKVIKRIENGEIRAVSDGHFETNGNLTDYCVPVNSNTKSVSDRILSNYQSIHKVKGNMNLNFPDIYRKYIQIWLDALAETGQRQNDVLDASDVFTELILNRINNLKSEVIMGVYIFRQ